MQQARSGRVRMAAISNPKSSRVQSPASSGGISRRSEAVPAEMMSPGSSGDLADLHAPLAPQDAFNDVLDKLHVMGLLARRLSRALGFGWLWLSSLVRLMCYSCILWPGFLLMGIFYFCSSRVKRNIWYGRQARNLLDLYVPYRHWLRAGRVPVVVFVTGGAWTIGYKAWGALLARRLSQRGILVACLDYRNFPQGSVSDMTDDIATGIAWTLSHAAKYGGDPNRLFVMGQSCGGHLAALTLLQKIQRRQARESCSREASPEVRTSGANGYAAHGRVSGDALAAARSPFHRHGSEPRLRFLRTTINTSASGRILERWGPESIKGFIALSTPFDISGLQQHFQSRGLNRHLLHGIFDPHPVPSASADTQYSFEEACPYTLCQQLAQAGNAPLPFPQTLLLHGSADRTVPARESVQMSGRLAECGVQASCKVYPGGTHTSLFLEGPFAGGEDVVLEDVASFVLGGSSETGQRSKRQRMMPMIPFPRAVSTLASVICPF